MVMLFSLKPQRDNRQNALAVSPAKEKAGKKAVFSPHCGDETTTYYNRAFQKGPFLLPLPRLCRHFKCNYLKLLKIVFLWPKKIVK